MKLEETDFIEAGSGEKVILVHSSVAGAKQWRSLMETLSNDFHVIAINLFGYGDTRVWEDDGKQRLKDQARLIEPFLPTGDDKISIVGHSFGGSVAMKAAAMFKTKVRRLALIEPNTFYLLKKYGRSEAYQEAVTLRDAIKSNGKAGRWEVAAEVFANYWTGAGSWDAMHHDRKSKFAQALMPNFHEWDAVMNEPSLGGYFAKPAMLSAKTSPTHDGNACCGSPMVNARGSPPGSWTSSRARKRGNA
ncbi:hypothetical protein B9057_04055 [Aestuarium zhoushanense]|nr:hypothetical protein B9057_04055 [Aestuarium zhoushanense]